MVEHCHILLVTFPGQRHINPTLQFAKRLVQMGAKVTFFTSLSAIRRMLKSPSPLIQAITFAPFCDGYDNGWTSAGDVQLYISSLRTSGSEALKNLIMANEKGGHSIKHIVYTTLVTWAGKTETIELPVPGLPLLSPGDLPSLMLSSSPVVYNFALPIFREHFELLDRAGTKQKVSKLQMEEIAKGLIKTHKPFLWVIRAAENGEKLEDRLSCKQKLEKQAMIVQRFCHILQ
ncbi:Crocetin glucosyltransferase [Forsythia ovata]|uniref:Crocetin glucosyltransferase n=1 Tax=Forsythia ovata TaxID=205694 RepID=A0ABD1V208_9LAMI